MKKILALFLFVAVCLTVSACSDASRVSEPSAPEMNEEIKEDTSDILVVYFSQTGNTREIAEEIKEEINADIFEIIPSVPYTDEDLNYRNDECRANKEQNDGNAYVEIADKINNIDTYETILIGYPIWWGKLPKIICTFLKEYDLSGKKLIPFCTSGGSGIEKSVEEIRMLQSEAQVNEGRRFAKETDPDTIRQWLKEIGLSDMKKENEMVKVHCEDRILEFEPDDHASAKAFVEKLKEGDITVNMHDYGNFEKVGELGFSLPQSNEQITTRPGDVILYLGSSITIYYDVNSWNFTRLGTIEGMDRKTMLEFFGNKKDVTVTFSMK